VLRIDGVSLHVSINEAMTAQCSLP
jgi:hypothetical protein